IIEERAGFIGRWIAGLLGIAFTVETFLTVPILVSRGVGLIEAVKESAVLLKKTWGENIAGNVGLGLAFALAYFLAIAGAFVLFYLVAGSGSVMLIGFVLAMAVIAIAGLALMHAALQGIYSAALYRYARGGGV